MTGTKKETTKQHTKNQFKDIPLEKRPKLTVYPRSKKNIFQEKSNELKDLLPDFQQHRIFTYKNFELRFYVDIATKRNNVYMGHRKLTVVVHDPKDKPLSNKAVSLSRKSGSEKLRFLDTSNNQKKGLSGADAPKTDSLGMVEVTIVHPAENPNNGKENLVIEAKVDGSTSEIRLTITRNDVVSNLNEISRRNETNAEHILVHQPISAHFSPSNQGIKELQEVINEVVSRHNGIPAAGPNRFIWLTLDGIYGNQMKRAINQYLTTFTSIQPPDYPYNLNNISLSQNLISYLKAEYLFDPESNENKGKIIDRNILIGSTWAIAPNQIDGLLELKEGVIDRLKTEMVNLANTYINCATFWLHRPVIHQPYQQSANWVFRITNNNIPVKTVPDPPPPLPPSPPLLDLNGNAIVVNSGDLLPSPSAPPGGWTQITYPGVGNGWIPSNSGRRIRDDQNNARNSGLHGAVIGGIDYNNGVAYSFGCKDLPDDYSTRLTNNPNAPPNNAGGNRLRIAHWDEYENEHRVGRTSGDVPAWPAPGGAVPATGIQSYIGCDCSGFVQACITQARFPAPQDNVAIVPNTLTWPVNITASRVPQNAIGASAFVPNHAREFDKPQADITRHWMRQGDIIYSDGPGIDHIVFVAEDRLNALNNNNTFHVFNEWGSDRYRLANGNQAPVDQTRFLRKALRMPFHYWRRDLTPNSFHIAKIYIWF